MGELLRTTAWVDTPLGVPADWPAALRTAVGICLTSRFPMLLVWGPELLMIYNDGYREMLGTEKHPRALGAPASAVFPEVWDTIGPMFDRVMRGDGATWVEDQMLVLERNGYPEQCYFTYSYSPILTEEGEIAGVLDTVTETTTHVVANRRLACLGELAVELVDTTGIADVCLGSVAVLDRHPEDITFADIYLDAGESHVRFASTRWEGVVTSVQSEALRRVAASGEAEVLEADPDSGAADLGRRVHLSPIGDHGEGMVTGVLALGINGQRELDEDHRSFLGLVTRSVSDGLASASRRSAELGEQRRISDALQDSMLSPTTELSTIASRYLPALGNISVGGDWYDFVELDGGRTALMVGDCVGHGLGAATLMGQLRSASRALLLEGQGPGATLSSLDRFASSLGGADCTTVFCGIVDPGARSFTYAAAGHPPPLLARAGSSVWLDDARSVPLGIDPTRERHEAKVDLVEGDALLLYTDGLVERRGETLDEGMARLRELVDRWAARPVGELADALVQELLPDGGRDDVALLIHRPE